MRFRGNKPTAGGKENCISNEDHATTWTRASIFHFLYWEKEMSYRSEPCSDQTRRWFQILKGSKFNCVGAGDWNLFIYCLTLSNGGCCSVPVDRIVLVVVVVQGIVGNRQPQTTPLCYSHSTGGRMSSVSAFWYQPINNKKNKRKVSLLPLWKDATCGPWELS